MKSRGTYLLLTLFFASLGLLWWADVSRVPTRLQRERMNSRILHELLDLKPDDLRKVEIIGDGTALVFERRPGNRWQMTSPIDVEADPSKVETLAYNLKELSRKPEAATLEGDPSRYGLAKPERVVRLWGEKTSAPLASLDVGLTNDRLGRAYVRPTGSEGIEVVDAKAFSLLALPLVRWRDHEIFRVPSFEVDAVTLKDKAGELKLQRGRDTWRIESPIRSLAAETRVEGLIADLGSLRVVDDTRFVANDVNEANLDRFGLKNPVLTIEIEAGRSNNRRPKQILYVGKPIVGSDGQVYARRDGQDDVLAVDDRVLKDLKVEANVFRSPRVADIKAARVSRIAVEGVAGEFEVVRSGNDWTLVRPSPLRADKKAVEDFLKSLEQLETTIYRTAQNTVDSGLEKPLMTLKIWQVADPRDAASTGSADPNGNLALDLQIGRRDAGRRVIYAQIAGDPTILALPDTVNSYLPRSVLAFRDRQVLSQSTDPIRRIKIAGGSRSVVLNAPPLKIDPFRNLPLGWWMVEAVDAPADAPSVGSLLRVLAGFRAESLVTERAQDLAPLGLNPPSLTLTWSSLPRFSMIDQPPTPIPSTVPAVIPLQERSLLVGGPVADRPTLRYAKLSDRPLVFTIGAEVLGVLESEWRDHQVLSFAPERVRKVQFNWPDRGFTIERSGDLQRPSWSFRGPVDAPDYDPRDVLPLLKSASSLTTNRYAQYLGDFPTISGLVPPRVTIRFDLDDGSLPRTLALGVSNGQGQVFATNDNGSAGSVFLLPEQLFKYWLKPPRSSGDLPDNVFER